MAQPWAVFAGSVMSAAVGVLVAQFVPQLVIAAALAVGLAVSLMLALRCLHPPGASLALLAVLEPATHTSRYLGFVLFDVVLLIVIGIVYNRVTGRAYPRKSPSHRKRAIHQVPRPVHSPARILMLLSRATTGCWTSAEAISKAFCTTRQRQHFSERSVICVARR
ncbi:HPP family protein [Diaphorobacter aerolatus]|uniref:HPP family protein n=1 Tax=Diaphorobacter aerolatus TaxID=1288495 RepID=UPI001D01E08B|nr:HPP family protein [Diaphorobacter aerolatus]